MPDTEEELPWEALLETEGEVPWTALHEFASALHGNPDLLEQLEEVYDEEEWSMAQSHETYADLYIPAIIALASEGEVKQEEADRWGRFLIEKLLQAGEHDDDIGMELTSAACGNMGPAVLPRVLDTIDRISPDHGAWFPLWGLMRLAAESPDERIRQRVIQKSCSLLKKVEDEEIHALDAVGAAWALAGMRHRDSFPLMKRVAKATYGEVAGGGDMEAAVEYIEGKHQMEPWPPMWDRPISEWLPEKVEQAQRLYEMEMEMEEKVDDLDGESAGEPLLDQASEGPGLTREPAGGQMRSDSSDMGRNDPCPCGSGKKYKHCCGKVGK